MTENATIGLTTRVLAACCTVCPFCVAARRFPRSAFARALRRIESSCPACRAYDRVAGRAGAATGAGSGAP